MQTTKKTIALAGAGVAVAAALGLTGATLANAAGETTKSTASPSPSSSSGTLPGGGADSGTDRGTAPDGAGRGMRDGGGTLTADAASKAVAAAQEEVDGGTVSGVRATSSGTYVVEVTKSDDTHVHVLLDASFAVTSVEEGGKGGRGRPSGPPGSGGDTGTGSTDPSDANGTTSTSA